MKRVQLFEFEDFNWFPSWLRTCMTNVIKVMLKLMGIDAALAKLIAPILKEHQLTQIVDMGSGSGGAMPDVLASLEKEHELSSKLILTDLYPNQTLAARITAENPNISYQKESVDATNIASAPAGLKTMVNCFHHMPPATARKILTSAAANKQPLLIYEMTENKIPFLVWLLFLPIGLFVTFIIALFLTPMVRPMTWQQIVFTYPIPIIPLFYAWDGQASMPRMYASKDIDELIDGLSTEDYTWEKGFGEGKTGKKLGTYLLGLPK